MTKTVPGAGFRTFVPRARELGHQRPMSVCMGDSYGLRLWPRSIYLFGRNGHAKCQPHAVEIGRVLSRSALLCAASLVEAAAGQDRTLRIPHRHLEWSVSDAVAVPLTGIEPAQTRLRKPVLYPLSYRGVRQESGCSVLAAIHRSDLDKVAVSELRVGISRHFVVVQARKDRDHPGGGNHRRRRISGVTTPAFPQYLLVVVPDCPNQV
jgi:hypothetical protein